MQEQSSTHLWKTTIVSGKLDWYERLGSLKVPSWSCLLCRGSKEEVSPARHGKYADVLGIFGISEYETFYWCKFVE